MHEIGNVVIIWVICEIRNYAWKLTFYESIFGFHRRYQMSGRLSLNIIVHIWLHWNRIVIWVHWIICLMWCALFNHESFILCVCLCTILGHPSVEGSGEPTSKGPLDPTRPGTLRPGHPTFCSGQAVATAAFWVDGRAAPLWRCHLDRCGVVWRREGHLLCGA